MRSIARSSGRVALGIGFTTVLVAGAWALAGEPVRKLAPLRAGPDVVAHAPFDLGTCKPCHARDDFADPGAARPANLAGCGDCHDELAAEIGRAKRRHPNVERCGDCHNPHNGYGAALLHESELRLCGACHTDLAKKPTHKKIDPKTACTSCHAAHIASRKGLLREPRPARGEAP